MIYSNFHTLPTVCTSMLNADGQLYVYILCVFLLIMPVNTIYRLRGRVVKGVGHLDHARSNGVREVVSSIPDRGNIVG